ncbi:MAG TPA: hypothetical protein VGB15_11425 [Longimicrobium sp.]|jgi:hypothetical protein
MEDTQRRPKALLEPKTLAGTVVMFTVGYVLVQPTAQLLLHAALGDPLPFTTRVEWGRFVVVCAAVGAAAGLIWRQAGRMPRGSLLKAWVRSGVTMLPMGVMLSADEFSRHDLVRWLTTLVVIALVTGAMFIPFYRLSDRAEATPPQPRSGGA